jgi:hypothetical protein
MNRTFVKLGLVLGALGSLFGVGACSSSSSSDAGDGGTTSSSSSSGSGSGSGSDAGLCAYGANADLTMPTVTFSHDVQPVLQLSCSIGGAACHGSPVDTTQGRPFFGLHDGGTDAAAIISGMVGQPSSEDPKLNLVKAGDPQNSYLVHKLIGDQGTLKADCANSPYPDCGQTMPETSGCLPADNIDVFRRWIAQGAQNN